MQLEDYFFKIQEGNSMNNFKETTVSFNISTDNYNDSDYPDTHYSFSHSFSGPTWIQIVEEVLKVLEASYGYDIRSQVYYSVKNPLFDHNYASAPGRELNSDLFHNLLNEHPGLNNGGEHRPVDLWKMNEESTDENTSNS